MVRSKKKFSGFTLLELIIVMAIFTGIAVGALAMIRPAMQLFSKTSSQEGAGANIDNISRYLQENLRYADRVNIYNGWDCSSVDDFLNKKFTGILPSYDKDDTSKIITKKYVDAKPLEFFRKYYYADSQAPDFFDDKNVNIMEIDTNGMITIYTYSLSGDFKSTSKINDEFYQDYKFSIKDWNFAPPDMSITMDIEYNGVTKDSSGNKTKLNQESKLGLTFINIAQRSEYDVIEETTLDDGFVLATDPTDATDEGYKLEENVLSSYTAAAYKNFSVDKSDPDYKMGNTYIVYTLPEIIIP